MLLRIIFMLLLTGCATYSPTREQCIRYALANYGIVPEACEHYYEPRKPLAVSLNCAPPTILNTSEEPWNEYDQSILENAKKRCVELYSDAPCVSWFKKYNVKQYSVLCKEESK